jgi:predicted regulator of Ras-like GTPase activity (Roadblock/LC7/MglB family)
MEERVENILRRLMAIDGVSGAVFAAKDGAVVASTLEGEDEEILGAMAAACYDSTARYIGELGIGNVWHALYETPTGAIQIADVGDYLLIVRTTQRAGLGRIRLELAQAGQRLSEHVGAHR